MVTLKYQCYNCNYSFEFDVGDSRFTTKRRLKKEIRPICPICNESKKLKIINTPELERLYSQFCQKNIRKQTINRYMPGILMEYNKIFGIDKKINFNYLGSNYYLFDSYCVNPYCTCKIVYLNFFDGSVSGNVKYSAFSFVVDYGSGIIQETMGLTESKAYEIYALLDDSLLKSRHEELKKEVQPSILKKFKNEFIPTKKLGRNEPCHCGSGKKYKKCCLGDDIKKYGGRVRVKDEVAV